MSRRTVGLVCVASLCVAGFAAEPARPAAPSAGAGSCPPLPPPGASATRVSNVEELQGAIAGLVSGQEIVVEAGVYPLRSTLRIRGGVTGVTIRGATGLPDDVVFEGRGMTNADYGQVPHGILIEDASDVLVADLTIRNVYYHPVQIQGEKGPAGITLRNLRLIDAGEQLVKVSTAGPPGPYADNGTVECSTLEYSDRSPTYYTNGVDVLAGSEWTIRGNLFRRIRAPAGELAGPAVLMWRNSIGSTIEDNVFVDCDRAIAIGLAEPDPRYARDGETVFDHQGGIVRNNMIVRPPGSLTGDIGITANFARDIVIVHNTVILNGTFPWGAIEYRFGPTTGVVRNNLTDAPIWRRDGAAADVGDNVVTADPSWFVNVSAGDLHLVADAPAIDLVPPVDWAPRDIDGDPRPSGPLADPGADEFVGTAGATPATATPTLSASPTPTVAPSPGPFLLFLPYSGVARSASAAQRPR